MSGLNVSVAGNATDAIKGRAAIVGIGQTAFGSKGLPDTELSLACQAISAALDDAGIAPADVDGLSSFTMEPNREVDVAKNVGLGDITFFTQVGYGGGAACGVVGHAAMAVATGQCEVAVAWRARKRAAKSSRPWANVDTRLSDASMWSRTFGLLRPVDEIAMLTRRHMHEFGTTRDHLANVALAARKHANRNPAATMYERPLTREQYMDARWISEPLCLFDNCLETDGGLAIVITTAERARDLRQPPAYVHTYAQGLPPQHQTMTNFYNDDPLRGPAWTTATRAVGARRRRTAGRQGRAALRRVQPADPVEPRGLRLLRAGEGGPFTDGGAIEWPDGRLPVNTSGAGMSEAYVHGFNLILEGVRQIRGTSTSQVEGADVSLVTSGEGVPTSAILFTKDA